MLTYLLENTILNIKIFFFLFTIIKDINPKRIHISSFILYTRIHIQLNNNPLCYVLFIYKTNVMFYINIKIKFIHRKEIIKFPFVFIFYFYDFHKPYH